MFKTISFSKAWADIQELLLKFTSSISPSKQNEMENLQVW